MIINFPSQLCPADIEQELIQDGDTISGAQWRIGDNTNIILGNYSIAEENGVEIRFPKMQMYIYAAGKSGKSTRSVRRYAATAKFYVTDIRQQYAVLSFEHLAEAMTYPGRWKELLDACLTQMERTGGSRPSVDWMRCYASPDVVTEYEASLDFPAVDPVGNDNDPLEYMTTTPTQEPTLTAAAVKTVIKHLVDHQRALTDAVNRLPIEGAVLYRFLGLAEQMEACIAEIAQSLEHVKTI